MFRKVFVLTTYFFITSILAFSQQLEPGSEINTAAKLAEKEIVTEKKVRMIFDVVDLYMDIEYYDSAQTWLNKIPGIYEINEPSVFNYYLFSRQAEVDYYNGLNQLGVTNASRGLKIALQRNDRVLLQDAYNFLGLLYLGMDSLQQGKNYFLKALHNISPLPYAKPYLYQSMPHHIYGNLAEAYEKLKMYDSAFIYSRKSLQEAVTIKNTRGIAIAYNSLARIFFLQQESDSALVYYRLSDERAIMSEDYDIQLLNQSGTARVYASMGQANPSNLSLSRGLYLMDQHPKINTYFKREFLKEARKVYSDMHNQIKYQEVTNALLELEKATNKKHFNQIQFILNNSIANEARYIRANLEQDKKSKQLQINQLSIVILVLCLLGIIMAFYQYSVKEKLKLSTLKNKISQDLHDDVGASLSSINMSAALAEKLMDVNPDRARSVLKSISENAEDGISTLSDIVWAMKPQTNSGTTFESRVKNYAYNLLSVNEILCNYNIAADVEARLSNIEVRKNLLLIIKEAFNNIARHSQATHVTLTLSVQGKDIIQLRIEDDGTGFDDKLVKYGNGIHNMNRRISDIQGKLSINSSKTGTSVKAVFHL